MKPFKVIWLQIGEFTDLEELTHLLGGDVSWCDEQVYENDIRYVLDEDYIKAHKEWEQAQEDFIR